MSSIEYINSVVLTASAATVTFSNIPDYYEDLKITGVYGGVSAGPSLVFRFNLDSSSLYSSTYLGGNGSAASSGRLSSSSFAYAAGTVGGVSTAITSIADINILSYSSNLIFKTLIENSGNPTDGVSSSINLWRSTDIINSISLAIGSSFPTHNLASGSTFTLWGVR